MLNASEEDWIRYDVLLSKLSEDFDDKTKSEDTQERLNRFYKVIEEAVTTLFDKKEAFKSDDEKKKDEGKQDTKESETINEKENNDIKENNEIKLWFKNTQTHDELRGY